jgi:hypothetical protein
MLTITFKKNLASVGILFAALCAVPDARASAIVETGKFVASDTFYKVVNKDVVKITFDVGSAEISNETFATLADFVTAANAEAKVDRYLVATWADQPYPAKGELSKAQRKLADLRSENIKKGLSVKGVNNVDTFEMTEQPNWIQRTFSTEVAEIKSKGRGNTQHERLLKEIGQKLRDQGGPRTAVIVAKFKNEVLSE